MPNGTESETLGKLLESCWRLENERNAALRARARARRAFASASMVAAILSLALIAVVLWKF